ncbi:MAG: hypothetical protein HY909_19285 [Deltaproteobacteria bacterium]|nr:hypothetical protein [Deltaproteobacteria bacterium]
MEPSRRGWALWVFAVAVGGCPSTTAGSAAGDAGDAAGPPGDAPLQGPCRWSVGEAVVLEAPGSPSTHRALLDLQPAEGGAWALFSDDAGGARQPDTVLERLTPSGRRREGGVVRFPSGFAPEAASLAVDETYRRYAVLAEAGGTGMERCSLALLDSQGRPSAPRSVTLPAGGFSLAGCRYLQGGAQGFTFLSEQVRALWGVSMVQLDPAGSTPSQRAPTVFEGYPPVSYARFPLPDRAFALLWSEPAMGSASLHRLLLRLFNADGDARAERVELRGNGLTLRRPSVVSLPPGMVALWEEADADPPRSFRIVLRTVDAAGLPGASRALSEARAGGSSDLLTAVTAGGELLAGYVTGSGVLSPRVLPLGPDGGGMAGALPLPLPAGATRVEALRLSPTQTGALAVFTTDPGAFPNRAVAVPLTCGR